METHARFPSLSSTIPGAKVLWLQLGVRSNKAKDIAEAAGIRVVQDRCPKIEFSRLFGELGWHGFNSGVISSKRRPVGSNPDAKPAAQKSEETKGGDGEAKKEEKKKTPDVVFRGFETRAIHAGAAPDATTGGTQPQLKKFVSIRKLSAIPRKYSCGVAALFLAHAMRRNWSLSGFEFRSFQKGAGRCEGMCD